MDEQLSGRLGDVEVILEELVDREQRLLIERVDGVLLEDLGQENFTQGRRQLVDQSADAKVFIVDDGFFGVEDLADLDGNLRLFERVCNVPTYGTASVSQFSIALLLEICHHIGHHSESVHAGNWATNADWCYWDYPLIELEGKTIGIIGFGRIGQAEGRVAKALGMKVLAHDLYQSESGKEIAEYVDLDTLFAKADVITLHCNLTPENTGMINKNSIAKMKDGVILINNARGQLIVEQDVADALNSGKMAAAGLDVVYTEPIKADNPLLQAKNCIITPHISWAPKESRQRIMDITVDNVKAFLNGAPQNVVNK